jgi:hypothetical protein
MATELAEYDHVSRRAAFAKVGCSKLQTQAIVHDSRSGLWGFALTLVFLALCICRLFGAFRIRKSAKASRNDVSVSNQDDIGRRLLGSLH